MAEKKVLTSTVAKETIAKSHTATRPLFTKDNYMWMGIGAAIVALGMLLMSGGKNENANQFDYNVVYSTTRVTVGPILILLGLMVEIYAIFKRPKAQH